MGTPYNTTHTPMPLQSQEISFTTVSATAFAAVPAGTVTIRISGTQALYYEIASSCSATKSAYLPAGVVEYVACQGGNVITVQGYSTAGRAFLTPCAS